jgi:hypothetical protein
MAHRCNKLNVNCFVCGVCPNVSVTEKKGKKPSHIPKMVLKEQYGPAVVLIWKQDLVCKFQG